MLERTGYLLSIKTTRKKHRAVIPDFVLNLMGDMIISFKYWSAKGLIDFVAKNLAIRSP